MAEGPRKEISEELTNLCAHFFAAQIVLADSNRATQPELDMATERYSTVFGLLSERGYAAEKSEFEKLPEGELRGFATIVGPKGYVPTIEGNERLVIPGPAIQSALSHSYNSWFHNLKKR